MGQARPDHVYLVKTAYSPAGYTQYWAQRLEQRGGLLIPMNCQVLVGARGGCRVQRLRDPAPIAHQIPGGASQRSTVITMVPAPVWFEMEPATPVL